MDKILTIVIPTYNMEKYLRKCLDSLIIEDKDLFDTLEVLVVNDGSKDSSSAIAHEYQDKYPHVFRVIDKENGNYGSCVNRGLKEATGKYIKILDADDSFDNTVFIDYLKQIRDIDADLVFNDFALVNDENVIIERRQLRLGNKKLVSFNTLTTRLMCKDVQMHSITYRTHNLRRINYIQAEGISYTDQQWAFTPLSTIKTVFLTNKMLYLYIVGRVGQTMDMTVRKKNFYQNIICLKKMLDDFGKIESPSDYMIFKLKCHLKGVYYNYLIESLTDKMDEILELDKYIAENNPFIYKELDHVKLNPIVPLYFIKEWHSNTSLSLPSYYKKLSLIGRAVCKEFRKIGVNIPML